MSRILVTGASGFLGANTLPVLQELGFEVHALSRRRPPADVRWHPVDLLLEEQVGEVVARVRPTHLLHLAWYVGPDYAAHPANLHWITASALLLRAFLAHGGFRAVMTGTCYEYGWSRAPLGEFSTPLAPATVYGASKVAVWHLSRVLALSAGAELAWIRPFFLYGPHEAPHRLAADVARSLLAGREALVSDGLQRRDYLFAPDAAKGLGAVVASSVTGPLNLASGLAVPVRDLVQAIGVAAGREGLIRYGAIPRRAGEPELIEADTGRMETEVGWRARTTLAQGAEETVAWWRTRA